MVEEQRIIVIEKAVDRIEKTVDRNEKLLSEHIKESEAIRAKVGQHDRILVGGELSKMTEDIRDVRERVIKIEERILSRGGVWRDLLQGLTIISLLIAIITTVVALG